MSFITDFGDQAVVLPLALAVAAALALAGWRRGAVAWLLCVTATLFAVLVGKLAMIACGPVPFVSLRSPSGHTAAAAVAYGGLLALLAPPPWRTRLAVGAALAVAIVVGASRLALAVHSRSEVAVGAAIGVAGALLLARLAGESPKGWRRAVPLAVAVGVVVLLHGEHLRAEDSIVNLSHVIWPLTLCAPR
jgi:membrane-associated phospholipid phosphatase